MHIANHTYPSIDPPHKVEFGKSSWSVIPLTFTMLPFLRSAVSSLIAS